MDFNPNEGMLRYVYDCPLFINIFLSLSDTHTHIVTVLLITLLKTIFVVLSSIPPFATFTDPHDLSFHAAINQSMYGGEPPVD